MNKQKDLWNKLAQSNSKYYINSNKGKGITEQEFWESGEQEFRTHIWNDDLLKPCQTMLDIGCGIGRITQFMRTMANLVIGTDISGEMIKQAKKRFPDITFIETDGYTLPLEDNSVDVAFSYLVFQHMKDREMVESNLKEVQRILKPTGIFKVRIRTDYVKHMSHWWAGVNYSEAEIRRICEDMGYTVVKAEPVSFYGLWLWLANKDYRLPIIDSPY